MGFWRRPASEGGPSEDVKAAHAPFVSAVDAFAEALFNDGGAGGNTEGSTEDQQVEQQLLDEAMRQSLQDSGEITFAKSTPSGSRLPEAAAFVTPATVASVDKLVPTSEVPSFVSKFSPHSSASSVPKPMARFIKDVTLPDGSAVVPGSTVIKTWKIRNDGDHAWPEGVSLSFSSGDLLAASPSDLVFSVGQLQAGEEVDVSVRLSIPETTGRHVTYFRLRTKEGHIFGQRLWADLRVTEPDADWVGVKDLSLSTGSTAVPSPVVTSATPAVPIVASVPIVESASVLESTRPVEQPVVTAPAVPAAAPVVNPAATDVWATVWSRELQILSDMGFSDTAMLIPLLQEHVGLPVSLCPQLNGIPPAEGMQKLVAVLLSRSGTFQA